MMCRFDEKKKNREKKESKMGNATGSNEVGQRAIDK